MRRPSNSTTPSQPRDQIVELGIGLLRAQFVRHLVRHRHHRAVLEARLRHQDLIFATLEPGHDLGRRLRRRELVEELLDVRDLERALLQRVLADEIRGRLGHRAIVAG